MDYYTFCEDEALKVKVEGRPVHQFFAPEDFLQFGLGTMRGSLDLKDQIVDMPIDTFLGLAEPIPADDEKRHAPISKFKKDVLDGKRTNWGLPILILKENEDGIWKVIGHDGRHRAILLKSLGYDTMPVHLSMPKGLLSPDYIPEILWCQNDKNVDRERDYYPFPIKPKDFNAPYVKVVGDKVELSGNKGISLEHKERAAMDGGTDYPAGCDSNNLKDYIGAASGKGMEGVSKGTAPQSCTTAKKNFEKNFVPNVAYRKDNTMPASTLKEYYSKKG